MSNVHYSVIAISILCYRHGKHLIDELGPVLELQSVDDATRELWLRQGGWGPENGQEAVTCTTGELAWCERGHRMAR